MVHSVSIRLHECFSEASTLGGISLQGPLHAQTPIDIAKANRKIELKSHKEAWKNANCLKSLTASGVYEAAGNVFWLNLASLPAWEVRTVLGSEISWTQLGVGRLFWSEEKFKRSADTWNLRQYNVHCSFFFYSGFVFSPVHWRLVPGSPLRHWTCVALGVVVQHG